MADLIKPGGPSTCHHNTLEMHNRILPGSSNGMLSITSAYFSHHNAMLLSPSMYIISLLALAIAIFYYWSFHYRRGQRRSSSNSKESISEHLGGRRRRRNLLTSFYGSSHTSPPHQTARTSTSIRMKRVPPGPTWKRLPVIGHLHLLGPLPHRSLQKISERYGPIVLLHLGIHPTVVISSPAMAKLFLHDHDHAFSGRPAMEFSHLAFYGQGSALMQPNDKWRSIRRLYTRELLSPRRVLSYKSICVDEVSLLIRKLRSNNRPLPSDGPNIDPFIVDIRSMASEFIFNVMTRVLFNQRSCDEISLTTFPSVYARLSALFGIPLMSDFVPWLWWVDHFGSLRKQIKDEASKLDAILNNVLKTRLEQMRADIVKWERDGPKDMLFALMVQYLGDGSTMTLEDVVKALDFMERGKGKKTRSRTKINGSMIENFNTIKACILEMLTGSVDTTAALVEWAMVELLGAPESQRIMEKLKKELRGAPKLFVNTRTTNTTRIYECEGVDVQVLDEIGLSKLPYLQAVLKEAMRLHPSAPLLLPHMSMERIEVGGFMIPKKTRLIVNAWAIARDDSIWDNATEFRPERFLVDNTSYRGLMSKDKQEPNMKNNVTTNVDTSYVDNANMDLYEQLPFGRGRRSCPGSYLGISMASTLLANLIHSFDWQAIPSLSALSSSSSSTASSSSSSSKDGKICMDEVMGTSLRLRHPIMAIPSPI